MGAVTLISNGSMVLLKYKLNNVCGADHRPANGAQRTMVILIYHNILWLSIRKYLYIVLSRSLKKANTHYLRIKCVSQAHHENNAYYVRIKSVLGKYAFAHLQQPDGLILLPTPCIRAAHSCFLTSYGNLSFVIPTLLIW